MKVKIFSGELSEVEKEINKFLSDLDCTPRTILQSSNGDGGYFRVIISIWYV
jgi:hypothetical protein